MKLHQGTKNQFSINILCLCNSKPKELRVRSCSICATPCWTNDERSLFARTFKLLLCGFIHKTWEGPLRSQVTTSVSTRPRQRQSRWPSVLGDKALFWFAGLKVVRCELTGTVIGRRSVGIGEPENIWSDPAESCCTYDQQVSQAIVGQ